MRDILLHYPRDYVKFPERKYISEVAVGETAAVVVRIQNTPLVRKTRRMQITTTHAEADGVTMQFIWFRMPYIKNMLKPGNVYVFYGKVIAKNKDLAMEQPTIYTAEQYDSVENNLTPVYPLALG